MPRKIILDTDPGIDDSLAILFALQSPELEVVGLTTVFGNADVQQTTLNVLRVLEVAGRADLPVAAGAAAPLARPRLDRGRLIHGDDGLGNVSSDLPPVLRQPVSQPAAEFIVQTALSQLGEITLVAIGPLTNLALALQLEPRLAAAVPRVVVMGSAAFTPSNDSPVAEVNVYHDPEAATCVFAAGWPLTLVGLDVAQRTVMSQAFFNELTAHRNPLTNFIARIVPFYLASYRRRYGLAGVYTHDPSAIAYAIDPSLFRTERLPATSSFEGKSVEVCVEVESERLLNLFKERFGG